uniref:Uncharacterized protein n=1 Tax=Strigops habroptila TaxID=2489341 RepID=A0A672UWP4_STRHB
LCIIFLQAIYKDVNSKAYLLRLSSFFNLYLHSCSSNLFFFFNTVFNSFFFFWFIMVLSCFTPKKEVMSDSSEIFCHC